MTITPRSQADTPEGSEPLDDSEWVRSVVSAALVQASIPDEQAHRVLQAATAAPENPQVTSAPFSAPQKPRADGAGESSPHATNVDALGKDLLTKDLFTEDIFVDAPEVEELIQEPAFMGRPAQQDGRPISAQATAQRRAIPAFDGDSAPNGGFSDEVLSESDASLEGYRSSTMRTIIEWLVVVFLALVVAVLAKEFIVQAFWIPSESMETTVNVGDRVLVNKLSYQFNDVRRGDLVVFEKVEGTPGDTDDLIKRAVALPGETIEVRSDGRLWIWGPGETPDDALLLDEPYLDVQNALLNAPSSSDAPSATIWHDTCLNSRGDGARCTLDDQSYFMLGDNRSRSFDSRGFGPVPEDNLIGRAFLRIWPLSDISTL